MDRIRDYRRISLCEGISIMYGFGWSILVCYAVILLGEPSERRNITVRFFSGGAGGSGKGIQVYGKERATGR